MGIQRLSPRTRRRIQRWTGLGIVYGYANGGYTYWFITDDHRHGWLDLKTRDWGLYDDPSHIGGVCDVRWPDN